MNSTRTYNFLQDNLNHSAGAQDLFLQSMAEWEIDIAVAAEPYFVPDHAHWARDIDGSVAIVCKTGAGCSALELKERGLGFVVAAWERQSIIGVYFSPNKSLSELEDFLDILSPVVGRAAPLPVLVLGDLNAKAQEWGGVITDSRGEAVLEWITGSGLVILNQDTAYTCVRQNGGSVVDISLATPSIARQVQDWHVIEDVETLSDHNYIRFEVSSSCRLPTRRKLELFPRWVLTRLDKEVAEEAAIIQAWYRPVARRYGVEESAVSLRFALREVCNAAMPRSRQRPHRKEVYWWSAEIAALREECNKSRRAFTRSRRHKKRDLFA